MRKKLGNATLGSMQSVRACQTTFVLQTLKTVG
jgi:hypothetical protein